MNLDRIRDAERVAAKAYEEAGYTVTIGPDPACIPFSLRDYVPDLLAVKKQEHILIGVKMTGGPTEPYLGVATEVGQHPGWHFAIVNVTEDELTDPPDDGRTASTGAIHTRLQVLSRLLGETGFAAAVLPSLWTAYASALQLLVETGDANARRYSDASLLNVAHSLAHISTEDYERARQLLALRNEAVHKFNAAVTRDHCLELREMTNSMLTQYESAPVPATSG